MRKLGDPEVGISHKLRGKPLTSRARLRPARTEPRPTGSVEPGHRTSTARFSAKGAMAMLDMTRKQPRPERAPAEPYEPIPGGVGHVQGKTGSARRCGPAPR
jgi:hypothetical protein